MNFFLYGRIFSNHLCGNRFYYLFEDSNKTTLKKGLHGFVALFSRIFLSNINIIHQNLNALTKTAILK